VVTDVIEFVIGGFAHATIQVYHCGLEPVKLQRGYKQFSAVFGVEFAASIESPDSLIGC
jgi:hypothetical protein